MNRRSSWVVVRSWDSVQCHKIAMRLQRQLWEGGLTDGQERLFDQVIAELEWRSARKRRRYKRCWCEFCTTPFPEEVEY